MGKCTVATWGGQVELPDCSETCVVVGAEIFRQKLTRLLVLTLTLSIYLYEYQLADPQARDARKFQLKEKLKYFQKEPCKAVCYIS